MIIWVDDDLFVGPERDVDRLALLRNAALRHHTLIVSANPDEPRETRHSPHYDAWSNALPDRLREEVRQLRERTDRVSASAVTRGAVRVLVCAQDPGPSHTGCRLSITDAVRAIAQPLHVMVEHQINDAVFLRRIMPPVWRQRLETWERHGELRFVNGGGLSVMKTLVEYHSHDDKARLAFGLPADVWRLVHFIIYDHDGDTPEVPGEQSRLLGSACSRAGMDERSYRLGRRDQEHYVPIEVLRKIVNSRITTLADRNRLLADIDVHAEKEDERHFSPLPALKNTPSFKNEFTDPTCTNWSDASFERDGAWPEMTRLAERIASAI